MASGSEVALVPTVIGTFRVVYHQRTVQVVDLLERGVEQTGPPTDARPVARFPAGSPPAQLREYFSGRRKGFDLLVDPLGTKFDQEVWKSLFAIPPGTTVSYGELAKRSGHAGSARAVGGAVGRNPIPIVIPCHRVVGEHGDLTGFGLGLWRKRWLLQHEGSWPLKSGTVDGPPDRAQRTLDGALGPRRHPA
ncbi:MAG: methylated-DNA--[protein]-cysteine S-methyltransferase [Thermoplasmata archaeon]|nr:methylated-DNA--[protein]-cysteine S-methyltransferase [Thermoplasmata archaeon]